MEIEYEVNKSIQGLAILVRFTDAMGTIIFTSWDTDSTEWKGKTRPHGMYKSICTVPANLLKPGRYVVTVGAITTNLKIMEYYENILRLEFGTIDYPLNPNRAGAITPILDWTVSTLN